MKFVADSMLGSLAKWLRILGYDTLYFADAEDRELARVAMAEGRILLTRDTELARKKGIKTLLIKSDRLPEQLTQVFRELHLNRRRPFSRCPVCNTPLERVEKESIRERVPPYVYQTQEVFSECPTCHRIYWRGTHWQRMREKMQELGLWSGQG